MKRLIFNELLLLSVSQKTARRVVFDRNRTLIIGENETGKSQLLKTLYACFGAVPSVQDGTWLSLDVKALLRFEIDGVGHTILRSGDALTLFDQKGNLAGAFTGDEDAFKMRISDLFDFRLAFYAPSGASRGAPARYLFAPFYIDQDKGWAGPWHSLAKLKSSRRQDTIEYHVGIRPNSYFDAKARVHALQSELRDPEAQQTAIKRMLENMPDVSAEASTFTTDTAAFAQEIEELLAICRRLQAEEIGYRDRLVELENERISVRKEVDVVSRAQFEFRKDYEYASGLVSETIECPVCGADYTNGALERFLIAQDEDRCADLLLHLGEEDQRLTQLIAAEEARYSEAVAKLGIIVQSLETKQQQVTLQDLIKAEGRREFRANLVRDLELLQRTVDELSASLFAAKQEMKASTDKKLRREILDEYKQTIEELAVTLQVSPLPKQMTRQIAPKVTEGGSEFPRRLMAYYVAILRTIHSRTTSTYCPIVIDTVNQQDQSAENLARMFELLANGLPRESQLIFGCVDTRNVKFTGKRIELNERFGLLRAGEFDEVAAAIRPFLDARHAHDLAAIQGKDNPASPSDAVK